MGGSDASPQALRHVTRTRLVDVDAVEDVSAERAEPALRSVTRTKNLLEKIAKTRPAKMEFPLRARARELFRDVGSYAKVG